MMGDGARGEYGDRKGIAYESIYILSIFCFVMVAVDENHQFSSSSSSHYKMSLLYAVSVCSICIGYWVSLFIAAHIMHRAWLVGSLCVINT